MAALYAGYPAHEAASRFPLLDGEEFERLVESMRDGFSAASPIILHEGEILDGRNRALAAEEAGVEPVFAEWDGSGGDPWTFVFQVNVIRRHLSVAEVLQYSHDFELKIAAAKAKKKAEAPKGKRTGRPKRGEAPKKVTTPTGANTSPASHGETTDEVLAKAAGIPVRTWQRHKRVRDKAPDLWEQVLAKTLSPGAAELQLQERETAAKAKPKEKPKREELPEDAIDRRVRRYVAGLRKEFPDHAKHIAKALRLCAKETA